jgi:hypothetical protein
MSKTYEEEMEQERQRVSRVALWSDFDKLMTHLCEDHKIDGNLKWKLFRELCDHMESYDM